MLALVRPSISSARLIAMAVRCAIARAISVSSSPNEPPRERPAHSSPTRSPPADMGVTSRSAMSSPGHSVRARGRGAAALERRQQQPASTGSPAARRCSGKRRATAERSRRDRGGRAGRPRRRAGAASRASPPAELRGVASLRRPPGPGPRARSANRLGGAAVVELGVLDRARDERGDVDEQLDRVLGELVRGLRCGARSRRSCRPARDRIGTATIDWKRSSSSSGTNFIRGSSIALSRMNSGVRWRATQPVSPSSTENWTLPTASAYTGEAARIVSRPSSSR